VVLAAATALSVAAAADAAVSHHYVPHTSSWRGFSDGR
jgi:hypothetical protein